MSTITTTGKRAKPGSALDTITASLVGRQSRGDGISIEDQIDLMTKWCAAQNPPVQVGNIYSESDVSGRKPLDKRKGLKAAVEDIESDAAQMILTAYFDRFVRSVATRAEVLVRVEAKGGVVYTMDMGLTSNATPVSKFTGTVMAAAAELIADQAGEKTQVSKQRNIDRGVPPFPRITPAYQRREDGTLEPHPVNGPLIAEACRMRAGIGYESRQSYTKIARWLNEQGVRTRVHRDDEWHDELLSPTSVASILSSKLLIGEIHFGGFEPNLHAIDEPVCDRATWRKMHAGSAPRGRYAKSERLLARLDVLVCKTCGSRLVVHESRSSANAEYAYYRCGNRARCSAPVSVRCDEAEAFVSAAAIRLSASFKGTATAEVETEAARVEAEAAQADYDAAMRSFVGRESEPVAREVLDELEQARDAAVERHQRLRARSAPTVTVRTTADWDRLSFDGKRGVIRTTIARAVVGPGRGEGRIAVEPRDLFGE